MKICDICEEEHSEETLSCSVCQKVVGKYQNDPDYPMEEVRKALHDAFYRKEKEENVNYFRCAYTGMIGRFHTGSETLGTSKHALILNLDHVNPKGEELAVSLNIINKMKTDVPYEDFKKLVITLGEYFKEKNENTSSKLEAELLEYNNKTHQIQNKLFQ